MQEEGKFKVNNLELNYNLYTLLMKALQYYKNASIEFSVDGDVLTDIYVLTTKIEERTNMIMT